MEPAEDPELDVIAVTAGGTHSCAIRSDGSVKCWGNNFSGQLGLGDAIARGDDP